MRVGLALEIDAEVDHLSGAVTDTGVFIKNYFSEKHYGDDLQHLLIGVILTAPESDRFHPVRKFTFHKLLKTKIPGQVLERHNIAQYDIKPDYDYFGKLNLQEARQYIGDLVFDSIAVLDRQKSKFPGFDLVRFKEDLKIALSEAKAFGGKLNIH